MTDRGKIVKRIVDGLKTIAFTEINSESGLMVTILSTAEDVLFSFYKAALSNIAFTYEEKQNIGSLVCPALQNLGYKLFSLQSSFSSESIDSVRIQRSGLQFFIDTFKDFPASAETSETLEKTLKAFVERENVAGLDESLRKAVFNPYCEDSEKSPIFKAEIAKLPSNHWWFLE